MGPCTTHPFTLGLVWLLGGAMHAPAAALSTPIPSGKGSAPRAQFTAPPRGVLARAQKKYNKNS